MKKILLSILVFLILFLVGFIAFTLYKGNDLKSISTEDQLRLAENLENEADDFIDKTPEQLEIDRIYMEELKKSIEVKTVLAFFNRYKKNNLQFRCNLIKTDASKPHAVNIDECKKFLKALEDTGYLSKSLIAEIDEYIEKYNNFYKDDNITDGAPDSFDFGFISIFQEVDEAFNNNDTTIKNITTYRKINENESLVVIDEMPVLLTITLSKDNETYLIDRILTGDNSGM